MLKLKIEDFKIIFLNLISLKANLIRSVIVWKHLCERYFELDIIEYALA